MWIKRLHTEIHNIITIYIHHVHKRSIYFKIITCIILGLVISNVFACKTNSVFSDFVDSSVTDKRNRTGARVLYNGRILALAEPLSTHFTHFTHRHRQPISPISLTYRVARLRLGLAASQLDLAASRLVVLSVGFRSPRELGKF